VVALNPEGGGDQQYTSVVYNGDYNTGNLLVGLDATADGAVGGVGTTAQVRRCANPTSANPLWYGASSRPRALPLWPEA